jgi:hypothetical protein
LSTAAAIACLVACGQGATDPVALESQYDTTAASLAAAKELWAANAPRNYEYTVELSCFCFGLVGPVQVTVIDGKVARRSVDRERRGTLIEHPDAWGLDELAPSVDRLFGMMEEARATPPATVYAIYHPARGYPLAVYFDYQPGAADDEVGISITNLRPVRPSHLLSHIR